VGSIFCDSSANCRYGMRERRRERSRCEVKEHTHGTQNSKLTARRLFSLVLAEDIKDAILLTGDAELCSVAISKGWEVHGVLWVADEIHRGGLVTAHKLIQCLTAWRDDPLVRLPSNLLYARLRSLTKK
jgi:hypothetical protein